MFILGVKATLNARGVTEVTLFDTRMTVPTRGLDVTIVEGSKKTGRIFFAGSSDNDVYEFSYQVRSTTP